MYEMKRKSAPTIVRLLLIFFISTQLIVECNCIFNQNNSVVDAIFYLSFDHIVMEQPMKAILLLLTSLLLLVACAAPVTKKTETYYSETVKVSDVHGIGVLQKPVIADLDVKEQKVIGKSYILLPASLETAKLNALADALEKSKADVLIEPIYKTEKSSGAILATVTGFPGYYKNFRPITAEDLPLLNANVEKKTDDLLVEVKKIKTNTPPKSGSNIGLVLGIIGGTALLLVILLIGND